ncbi:MAG: GNAT family N-acetyltransferase [Desulfobulbus sp.]|jgi:predicted GNAT family acetyltransferase|nr:GNAT family N-acetyltransferase [Desulfobulbus sp.]
MDQLPRKNTLKNRYELDLDGGLAYLVYEKRQDGVVAFTSTFVPPELRGRNAAAILTRFALDDVRAEGHKVLPQCSYAASYLERNPEYADLRSGS